MHLKSLLNLLSLSLIPLVTAALIPPTALLHPSHLHSQIHTHLASHHGQHHPSSLPFHRAPNPLAPNAHACPPSPCLSAFMAHEASARNLCAAFAVAPALPKRLDWIWPCVDDSMERGIIATLTGACACLESGDDDLDYGGGAGHDL